MCKLIPIIILVALMLFFLYLLLDCSKLFGEFYRNRMERELIEKDFEMYELYKKQIEEKNKR